VDRESASDNQRFYSLGGLGSLGDACAAGKKPDRDGGEPGTPSALPRRGLPGAGRRGKPCREGAARLAPQAGNDWCGGGGRRTWWLR
jgi:hypothetical protein